MGFQLLTSTGEFTGFLNHQQYNSFFPSPSMTGSHGPYSDTSGGNSEEDSSLSSWHFGTSFLGPIRWWLVGGEKLVGITPSENEAGNGTSPFWIIRRYIHCHVRCRGCRSLYAKTSTLCFFRCDFCCFGVDVFFSEKVRQGCEGMKQRFVWNIQVLICSIFLYIYISLYIYHYIYIIIYIFVDW